MSRKLSSLLQYRFVKRGDSQSSENGSVSSVSSDLSTQPESVISTQSLVTPEKHTSSRNRTPDSKSSSQVPDSPIFGSRLQWKTEKLFDVTPSSSNTSSPWLSKENGTTLNGNVSTSKKRVRQLPSFSDSECDSNTMEDSVDFRNKMMDLKRVFPPKDDSTIRQALLDSNGDLDSAIDLLIDNGKPRFKRIKVQRNSLSEPDTPVQPRKRIRVLSSDSEDEIGPSVSDSQSTVAYGLESQRSDVTVIYDPETPDDTSPLTAEQEKKLGFLKDCFKEKSKKDLRRVLSSHSWNVSDATVALSASMTLKAVATENKVRAKAAASLKDTEVVDLDDDDDDDYEDGNESEGSEDSIEQEGTGAKSVIFNFFEDAVLEELMATPGCSKKKSELIVSLRPFHSWENMVDKFTTVKGLSYDLISGCREVIKIRNDVIRLMQRCEKISSTMEEVVGKLIHSNLTLDDDNQIAVQPSNLNPDLQLKPFQMVGLNWLRLMHTQDLNGILADEMGLGKTIQTIAFLAHLVEEEETGPHVIIVPSSTIENWIRECTVWCPSMKVVVYYGSQESRKATRMSILYGNLDFNVIITTYNMATGTVEDRSLFKKFDFYYAVFDEGHLLKNMSSQRFQGLMKISAHRRLLLTGTPLQNNLLELMSLLCFVMPNMFIGKTEQLKRVFTMISKSNDEKRSRYEQDRIAHAKRIMKPFVLRRLKSEVMSQLPQKTERVDYCAMIPDQRQLYDRLIRDFSSVINSEAGGGMQLLMKLRKAANHPLLHRSFYTDEKIKKMAKILCEEPSHKDRGALPTIITEDMEVMSDFELHKCCLYYKRHLGKFALEDRLIQESGKFQMLNTLLPHHKDQGHRVLLFSQFTSLLDILEVYLGQKKIKYIRLDGSTPVVERQKLIDQYNTDKEIFVFLLSTKAGGLGINLTSANVVILHDIDFNPYNDKQAEDRCHRVGQTREVQIVRLISKNSVEETILKCAQEKLNLEKDLISTNNKEDDVESTKDVASILKQALSAAMNGKLNS